MLRKATTLHPTSTCPDLTRWQCGLQTATRCSRSPHQQAGKTIVTARGMMPNDQCATAQTLTLEHRTCAAGQVYQAPICNIMLRPGCWRPPSCPIGSYEDASGDCRKPVANAKGAYSCADAASALNGKTCVWTSAFSVTITPDMYKCAEGARAVIGTDVICVLSASDANTTSAPSCLQGVLSTDGAYCIVPRSDAAPAAVAPVPSFTG